MPWDTIELDNLVIASAGSDPITSITKTFRTQAERLPMVYAKGNFSNLDSDEDVQLKFEASLDGSNWMSFYTLALSSGGGNGSFEVNKDLTDSSLSLAIDGAPYLRAILEFETAPDSSAESSSVTALQLSWWLDDTRNNGASLIS
jgi:hypothetical protein